MAATGGLRPLPFRLVPGRGAASGAREYAHIGGSVAAQKPVFASRGLDLSDFHNGTLNADIAPRRFRMSAPFLTLRDVAWLEGMPAEDFSFSPATVSLRGVTAPALVYYPRPETKGAYAPMPADTVLELLAPFIPGAAYGDRGEVWIDEAELTIIG